MSPARRRAAVAATTAGGMVAMAFVALPVASAATAVDGVVRTLAADTVEPSTEDQPGHGRSVDVYRQILVVGSKSYFLKGKRAPRTNIRVRVSGHITGNTFNASSLSPAVGHAGAAVASSGTTNLLVMLAYWTSPDSVTQASASTQMFTDTNGYYRDASFGGLGQTGAVTPWLKIAGRASMRMATRAATATSAPS